MLMPDPSCRPPPRRRSIRPREWRACRSTSLLLAARRGQGPEPILRALYGIRKVSTGDILRKAIQDGTELRLRVADTLPRHLVNDALMIGVVGIVSSARTRRRLSARRVSADGTAGGRWKRDGGSRRRDRDALRRMADVLVDHLSARSRADDKQGRDPGAPADLCRKPSRDRYYTQRGIITCWTAIVSDAVFESIEAVVARAAAGL